MELLDQFVEVFAQGLKLADAKLPRASSSKREYQAGIGPHTEPGTVRLALEEIVSNHLLEINPELSVKYPNYPRNKCDLLLRSSPDPLYIEIKMMRILGDNGKPNDNIIKHILSPYQHDRSALTDIEKLKTSGFEGKKTILIYGYESEEFPLSFVIEAFEKLADKNIVEACEASFEGLVHPVHQRGAVFGWIVAE